MPKVMIEGMKMPKRCLDCDFYIDGNSDFMLYGVRIGGKCKMLQIKDMDGEVIDYQNICKDGAQAQELLEGCDKRCPLQEVKE